MTNAELCYYLELAYELKYSIDPKVVKLAEYFILLDRHLNEGGRLPYGWKNAKK